MTLSSKFLALAVGLVVLPLAACGGGDDQGASAPASAVTIKDFAFKPGSISVPVGAEVTWTNEDSVAHTVKPDGDLFPTSPNIAGDTVFSHTYDQAGTFPYVCGIHNYMTGTVVVS